MTLLPKAVVAVIATALLAVCPVLESGAGASQSGTIAQRVARLQHRTVAAANADAAAGVKLSATVTSMKTALAKLAASGTNTSTGDAALADASAKLATVAAQAPGIVTYVELVSPTASRTELHAATVAVHKALRTLDSLLRHVRADVKLVHRRFGV